MISHYINVKNNSTKNITIGLYLAVFFYNHCKKTAKYKPIVMLLVELFLALM